MLNGLFQVSAMTALWQDFEAGRVTARGRNLRTASRKLSKASKAATLKVPLSSRVRRHHRALHVRLRVGFVPAKKGAHSSAAVRIMPMTACLLVT